MYALPKLFVCHISPLQNFYLSKISRWWGVVLLFPFSAMQFGRRCWHVATVRPNLFHRKKKNLTNTLDLLEWSRSPLSVGSFSSHPFTSLCSFLVIPHCHALAPCIYLRPRIDYPIIYITKGKIYNSSGNCRYERLYISAYVAKKPCTRFIFHVSRR